MTTESDHVSTVATAVRLGGVRRKRPPVLLSDRAAEKVRALLADQQVGTRLRIGVRPGGCSGFSHELAFDTERHEGDIVTNVSGIEVVVDPDSATLLEGAVLDHRDGLSGSGFRLENPKARRTCGCGQSFS